MAEAGRSLRTFYLGLGAISIVGIALIVHAATGGRGAPIVMAECGGPPVGNVPPRGVVAGPDSGIQHAQGPHEFILRQRGKRPDCRFFCL